MPKDEVLTNMDRLAAEGAMEVVLTGVQLGAWGKDLSTELHLADLISEAANRLSPGRLRLSSLEPWSVDEKLLQTIAEHERICPHLHLPLQSGDNRILAQMKRGYHADEFLRLVNTARRLMPEVAIGTDVVVGFPGEDQSAHENTIETLKELRPAYVHAFSYSPRPGTRAAKMTDRPAKEIVRARVAEIRDFAARAARRFRNGEIGKVRELLVEQRVPDGVKGMTETFVPTIIHDGSLKVGAVVKVKITGLDQEERSIAEVIK
jgi:threonylcarbamoyladenosine tRNA methylthiotransferase MtaB